MKTLRKEITNVQMLCFVKRKAHQTKTGLSATKKNLSIQDADNCTFKRT